MKFVLFPNNAVYKEGECIFLEPSLPLLINPLINSAVTFRLAALQHSRRIAGNHIPFRINVSSLIPLGVVKHNDPRWRRGFAYLRFCFKVLRAVSKNDFMYIFYPGNVALLTVFSCFVLRRPYALYVRGDSSGFLLDRLRWLSDQIIKRARFIICTGESLAVRMRSSNPRVTAVVPMSEVLFAPTDTSSHERVEKNVLTILFVGRMICDKGIYELLDSYISLLDRCDCNFKLIYVGEGPERMFIENKIISLGLRDRVMCMGHVSATGTLLDIYRNADIFCLPTYHEGFPRVLYEAMRFSLPIITTPVGQISGLLQDGKNALLCAPRSVPSLTTALSRLAASAELREALGRAGQQTLAPFLRDWISQSHGHQVLFSLHEIGFKVEQSLSQ